jgi:hypothetical protein
MRDNSLYSEVPLPALRTLLVLSVLHFFEEPDIGTPETVLMKLKSNVCELASHITTVVPLVAPMYTNIVTPR